LYIIEQQNIAHNKCFDINTKMPLKTTKIVSKKNA